MKQPFRQLINPVRVLVVAGTLMLLIYGLNAGDFFFHDSAATVENNSAIRIDGTDLEGWRTAALSTDTGPLGRPLAMILFAADHVLAGGVSARQVKVTNAFLHLLCGIFLFLFLKLVLERSPLLGASREQAAAAAAAAAAIWLLHPLNVSTVMYAVQRMTQVATLFTLAGLWLVFRARVAWLDRRPGPTDFSRLLLVGLVFTMLAALGKENGLLLPVLAAVTEATLFRGRVSGGVSNVVLAVVAIALVTPVLVILAIPLLMPDFMAQWYEMREFTLRERMLTQPRLLWHHIGRLYLPNVGAMSFYNDHIPLSQSLLSPVTGLVSLLAFAGLSVAAWVLRFRVPLLGFALLWFLYGHSMESTIVPLEMFYEHRNYLPAVGPLALLAGVLLVRGEHLGLARLGVGAMILVCAVTLMLRSAVWSSEKSLAEYQYRHHPDSVATSFHLAATYFGLGQASDNPEASGQYFTASRNVALRALEIDPEYLPAVALLIVIDSQSSHRDDLPGFYRTLMKTLDKPVLHISDVKFIAYLNECVMAERCPEPPGGQEAFLRRLYQAHPNRTHLLYQLALYCHAAGKLECAREELATLLAISPGFTAARELLFQIHVQTGNRDAASETVLSLLREDDSRLQPRQLLQAERGQR